MSTDRSLRALRSADTARERAARAEARQRALLAFVVAPEPASIETFLRTLDQIDGGSAHAEPQQIA